ncbi:MAG: DUF6273 domain-containing protein [Candidatus Ventricola sp.]
MNRMMNTFAALLLALLLCASAGCAEANTAPVEVGGSIVLGQYEQDNDLSNGAEPIEWLVLSVEGDEALLVSRYALDARAYNEQGGIASWVKSSLRTWLNSDFYDTAFTDDEKACIVTKELTNRKEANTADPVFLLSTDEAKRLFSSHANRQATPTAYAAAQGAYISTKYTGNVQWWLRTNSWESKYRAAYVAASGGVMTCGGNTFGKIDNPKLVVRPAIYVNLSALSAPVQQ